MTFIVAVVLLTIVDSRTSMRARSCSNARSGDAWAWGYTP